MKPQQPQPKLNIDLAATQPLVTEGGNMLFAEGVLLRKVSKFITATNEDAILPIPAFYDVKTGEILVSMLPKELHEEIIEYNKSLKNEVK